MAPPDDWPPRESGHYILNPDHSVTQCDLMTWAHWFQHANRCVAVTSGRLVQAGIDLGPLTVSTIFEGLDKRFGHPGPPILFETMVFGTARGVDLDMDRYSTWDEAVAGHQKMIDSIEGFEAFEWHPTITEEKPHGPDQT